MSYLSDPKDPAEIITVGFDFSNVTETPTNPAVSVSVRWGAESSPTLVASGAASIVGAIVYQRFTGGANLNDYNLKCLADTPSGDRIAVDAVLAVRTRPV
jgi:hypothetical protein